MNVILVAEALPQISSSPGGDASPTGIDHRPPESAHATGTRPAEKIKTERIRNTATPFSRVRQAGQGNARSIWSATPRSEGRGLVKRPQTSRFAQRVGELVPPPAAAVANAQTSPNAFQAAQRSGSIRTSIVSEEVPDPAAFIGGTPASSSP
ncbi:MAG: hypothetical protein ACF8XB_05355 [Planctomycetota bacterium JB042]